MSAQRWRREGGEEGKKNGRKKKKKSREKSQEEENQTKKKRVSKRCQRVAGGSLAGNRVQYQIYAKRRTEVWMCPRGQYPKSERVVCQTEEGRIGCFWPDARVISSVIQVLVIRSIMTAGIRAAWKAVSRLSSLVLLFFFLLFPLLLSRLLEYGTRPRETWQLGTEKRRGARGGMLRTVKVGVT